MKNAIRLGILSAVVVALGAYWFLVVRHAGLPAPGTAAYEQATSHFYRGLAALQVGLLDSAKQEFTETTQLAPAEPAGWANLGLAHLRLGEFEPASAAVNRAAELEPSSATIAFFRGRLETAQGRREQGVAELRRAVTLEPRSLQARTALIQEIENAGGAGADDEAQRVLEELLALRPENVSVLVERTRLAAKRSDSTMLRDSITRLEQYAPAWPDDVRTEFRGVTAAGASGNFADASRAIAFLRNVLTRVPAYREDRALVTPSAELIADPLMRFVHLVVPPSSPSPADEALSYAVSAAGAARATPWAATVALPVGTEGRPAVFAADGREISRVDTPGALPLTFPGGEAGSSPAPDGLVALDWNHDFRPDLVAAGAGGVRLFVQNANGVFVDATPAASKVSAAPSVATGAWAADIEMDGDLDIVVGVPDAAPTVLRNNGDDTWREIAPFPGVTGVAAFVWGDLDVDGDPDAAIVDARGAVHVFMNLQGGAFQRISGPQIVDAIVALDLGDIDADGVFDLVTVDVKGAISAAAIAGGTWRTKPLGSWSAVPPGLVPGSGRVVLADLDNNGALDLLVSARSATAIWLASETLALEPLAAVTLGATGAVVDVDRNGVLDLVGVVDGAATIHTARATRGYHYQVVRPRAQTAAGDQRINSFGIGGEVEVRSGRLVQKQTIARDSVHIGLGDRTSIDVTRIVWPNGVPQAEFDPAIDQAIVAAQRLKGSCPWVFADNGTEMAFVTDFLWRSPLGLKINASDTAGVTQTEDWVKIRGEQLVERNGAYDIRISAELWETHFVDHVSLLVVDHPADVDIAVDERFVPVAAPALKVHPMSKATPVAKAWDQAGTDVTDLVSRRDGRYLGTFERGRYQGVAADHFVEIDLGRPLVDGTPTWLVAYGWIYPTDSSINVAIGQGTQAGPESLSLEALDQKGKWVSVARGLGFPAGKNKTVLLDLERVARAGVHGAQRLRLRTNLEIYWDSLATATDLPGAPTAMVRVAASRADLGYRGFSVTETNRREEPEVPVYNKLATSTPRWRDLTGFYTRHGDVRALLGNTDDRYVIMNAGDELRFSFTAPARPKAGWVRDFVLIGDGWVKDGDFNTSYAKTVLPLPTHGRADYTAPRVEPALATDPAYLRHQEDWKMFHTRYVEPRAFLQGLRFDGEAQVR